MKKAVMVLIGAALLTSPGCRNDKIAPSGKSTIKVGVGETVITPQKNMQMWGFARSQVSTGVHDDLHSRSLVVEDAKGNAVVLMAISLVQLDEGYGKRIREGVTAKTGIPGDHIVVSCTHTHSGPEIRSDGNREMEEYGNLLVERCVDSVVKAWESRVPGRIGIEKTEVFELGRNRRYLLYGGVHPDPEVAVIKIEDTKGKLLGVAFNYGCHPSALDWSNTLFSEDWPYYAIQGIKKSLGGQVWAAYYQSAQGNINVGYLSELSAVGVPMPVRTYWYIEKKGGQMSDAVLKALTAIPTSGNLTVNAVLERFDYPLRESYPITLYQAEKAAQAARTRLAALEKKPEYQGTRTFDRAQVEVFQTGQRLDSAKRFYGDPNRPKTRSLEQQAIRIGDAVFVTFPGELFSDIGLAIKKQSSVEKTFVIGVTCGPGGYLPTAKDFIDGDYEVDGSEYSPKTEPFCIASSLELIKKAVK